VKQTQGDILFKILYILTIMKIPLRKVTALVLATYDEFGIITPSRFGMLIGINPYYVSKSLKHYATDEGLFKRWIEGSQRDGFEFQYQITEWGLMRLFYLRKDPLVNRYCDMLEEYILTGQTRLIPQLYEATKKAVRVYVSDMKKKAVRGEEDSSGKIWKLLSMYLYQKGEGML